jgi:DNA-binding response OmpR family regulator
MKRILMVDDDATVLDTFKLSFTEAERASIDFASTSEEAQRLLRANKYDKIICDLRLEGDVDGFQILRLAREVGVKIRVLLTAVSTPITVEGTAATYAFRKPCDCMSVRRWVLTDQCDMKRMVAATF